MMKQPLKQWSAIALMAILGGTLATSCASEEILNNDSKQPEIITITANLSQANTRLSFTEDGNILKTLWEQGDGFVITPSPGNDASKAKVFTIVPSSAGGITATFTGEKPDEADMYFITMPKTLKTMMEVMTFSTVGQEQDGNNPQAHLKQFFSVLKAVSDYSSFTFNSEQANDLMQSGIIKISLSNLPEAIVPTKISLTVSATSFRNHFPTSNSQQTEASPTAELALKNYSSLKAIDAHLVISVIGVDLKGGTTLTVTIESTTKTFYKVLNIAQDTTLEGGKFHKIIVSDGWQVKN